MYPRAVFGGRRDAFWILLLAGTQVGWLGLAGLPPSNLAAASFIVQQIVVFGLLAALADRGSSRPWRFIIAAGGTLYFGLVVVSSLILARTSLTLREIVPMLLGSDDVIKAAKEIGLTPTRVGLLATTLFVGCSIGGATYSLWAGPHSPRGSRATRWFGGVLVLLSVVFLSEQSFSREQEHYLFRSLRMPGYLQLFDTSRRSETFEIRPPLTDHQRAALLDGVGPPQRDDHVLFILLESFRADVVRTQITPHLERLALESWRFDNAFTEATYTPMAWNVLLFDEAAHHNIYGRIGGRENIVGSWFVAVLAKAGYRPHAAISTNFTYARTYERFVGDGRWNIDYFQAAPDEGDEPQDKNDNDVRATDHLVNVIGRADADTPRLMLLQLDSTHYTYPFPKDAARFEPYSEAQLVPKHISTEVEAKHLRHRYFNAAYFVDGQVGRVLRALRDRGLYERTAIIVTSDHGEGLEFGKQGHGAVFPSTMRVPLLIKLPGRAPAVHAQVVAHRQILPTILTHLGIRLPPNGLLGQPIEKKTGTSVLTLAPSGRRAVLTAGDRTTDLRLVFPSPTKLIATPVGKAAPGWQEAMSNYLNHR